MRHEIWMMKQKQKMEVDQRQAEEFDRQAEEFDRDVQEIFRMLEEMPRQGKGASGASGKPSKAAAPVASLPKRRRRGRPPAGPGHPCPKHQRLGPLTRGQQQPRLLPLLLWPGPPLLRGMRRPPKRPQNTLRPSRRCSRLMLRQSGLTPGLPGVLRTTP